MVDVMELVERTWSELGYSIRPLRWMVFVRTDPFEGKIGSIHLPGRDNYFYGDLGNARIAIATVLSAGKAGLAGSLEPGDHVCFQRLYFAWYKRMEDGTFVGWIDANQITGYFDGDSPEGFIPVMKTAREQSVPI